MNDSSPAASPPCHATRWRIATAACLVVMAIATATGVSMYEQFSAQIRHLQTQLKEVQQIRYIAVLLDQNQAPAMLVTLDPLDAALQVQRLNNVAEGREDSLQLWALSAQGNPRSLGVLGGSGKTLRLPAVASTLAAVPRLAISVEAKGGAEAGAAPRIPFLFEGAVVQKAL